LFSALEEACARQTAVLAGERQKNDFDRRIEKLTPREKEVMKLVIVGQHNREIATTLGISSRTVEVHKARMMDKLEVDSVPQLVRISLGADDAPQGGPMEPA
jgi:RNA polymerase sigma factor (sigma-70 family)